MVIKMAQIQNTGWTGHTPVFVKTVPSSLLKSAPLS